VDRHGDYLYRYALGKVGRADTAEDLVQEALLAAWRGRAKFDGRAAERSWLTAILKRKVIDWLRATVRERTRTATDDEWVDEQFTASGKWKRGPDEWASDTPEAGAERAEFWDTLHGCTGKLPARLRHVFVLWHLDERPGDEVCRAVKVSPNNLWVMLHRARLRLWRCLSRNWYGVDPDERAERRAEP
jgi:RNA polymerase sigma-70 factor (ECF subfamily)